MRARRPGGARLSAAGFVCLLVGIGICGLPTADGGITGFNGGTNYTPLASADAVIAGVPTFPDPETLLITNLGYLNANNDPVNNQGAAVWYNDVQDVTSFVAKFDYTMAGYDTWAPADGIVFVLQNNGLNAMGTTGGARGYTGTLAPFDPLTLSVGVSLNIYNGVLSGTGSDVQAAANGAFGDYEQTAPVNLISGNPIRTSIAYDGTDAYVHLEDLTTGDEYTTSLEGVPVPTMVGGDTAYVGFTGGTGGANALQEITNFSYDAASILTWDGLGDGDWDSPTQWTGGAAGEYPTVDTMAEVNTNIVTVRNADAGAFMLDVPSGGIAVNDDLTLRVLHSATFGPSTSLTLGDRATFHVGGTVSHDPAAPVPSLTIGHDSTVRVTGGMLGAVTTLGNATVMLPQTNSLSVTGGLTAGAGTVTKAGPGTLVLDDTAGTGISAPNATFKVEAGELRTTGEHPLGGSTSIELAGGQLTIDGGRSFGTAGDIVAGDLSNVTLTGSAAAVGDEISLTNAAGDQAGNAYSTTKQDITAFSVEFDYYIAAGSATPADEWQFIVQNNPAGTGASGYRGYNGMTDSFAAVFNIWGFSEVLFTDSGFRPGNGSGTPTAPVDLRLIDRTVHTKVDYDGAKLWLAMEDLVTGGTFNASCDVDLAETIGATDGLGYIGFGGGTGGAWADFRIANFTNSMEQYPIDQQDTAVLVTNDSTLNAVTGGVASFGPLTMRNGTLTTMGAHGGISFRAPPAAKIADTTIDPAATAVGFDPRVPTDYGTIDASGADVVISKEGPGKWVLPAQPLNLSDGASWVVNDGILEVDGDNVTGSLPVTINSGLMTMQGGEELGSSTVILNGGRLQVHDGRGGYGGEIVGFTQEGAGATDFTLNSNGLVGVPSITDGVLEITTSANSQATSAFYNTPQDARAFRIQFDYELTGGTNPPADGAGLVIQNDPDGVNALGLDGGGRGYQTMLNDSVGVILNLWNRRSDVDLGNNGYVSQRRPTDPINLRAGQVVRTTVIYDGRDITVEMENLESGNTFSTVYEDIDVPEIVGGDTAYFGFTGGTGGANATQHVSNFTNQSSTVPVNTADVSITVTDDSVLEANTHGTAAFGPLTMESGVLTTTGAFLGGISFRAPVGGKIADTTIDPGATEVGFDPQAPTDYGTIDASNADVTIVKAGSSHWSLATPPENLGSEAQWRVDDGTLELQGTNPLGGRPITVASGLLTMVGGDQLGGVPVTLAGGKMTIQSTGVVGSDIAGFGDGSDYTLNANADAAAAGVPNIAAGELQVTNNAVNEATSTYYNTRQDVGAFDAAFDYQYLGTTQPEGRPADGVGFVMQNNGINALGGLGGDMGYGGGVITDSVAFLLNLWDGQPRGQQLAVNGTFNWAAHQSDGAVNPVDGNVIHTTLHYDGDQLLVTLQDTTTGDTFSTTYDVDIPNTVGGTGAYVGFSGGTGGATADQRVKNFTMSFPADPIVRDDIDVLVTDDSALHAATHSSASFGVLTMQNGILRTSGAYTGGISFTGSKGDGKQPDTLIDPGATSVGFNPLTCTDLGVIDGQGTMATIRKVGPGDLVLDRANVNLQNATFSAEGGRLVGVPAQGIEPPTNPFNGAQLRIAGGEIVLATKQTGQDVTYYDRVNVDADGTLTAGAGAGCGGGAPGPATITIGSVALPVTLNSGTLALQSTDGYILNVAGPFAGPGNLDVINGDVHLSGGGSAHWLTVSDGTMTLKTEMHADVATLRGGNMLLEANLNVDDMILDGGTGDTGAHAVVVGNQFREAPNNFYEMSSPDTFSVTGADLATAYNVLLDGDTISVIADGAGGDILGFGNGSNFTLNAGGANPAGIPNITDGVLQLTSTANDIVSSAWFNTPQDINTFNVAFEYQLVPPEGNPADGAVFVVQNAGLNALGSGGGNLGYDGIASSVGLVINVYDPATFDPGLALFTGGDVPDAEADRNYASTAPVNLRSTNPIHFLLGYDGSTLSVDLEDTVTGAEFHTSYAVDIRSQVGAVDTAYLGFTGATGGLNANQQISNFTNALDVVPIVAENANLVVIDDSTLQLTTLGDARLGNLMIDPGVTLFVTQAVGNFNDVTTGHEARLTGNVVVRGNLNAGGVGGVGTLNMVGGFELITDDPGTPEVVEGNAIYHCEIGNSDPDSIVYPQQGRPYFESWGYLNDKVVMSRGDAYLDGELKLPALDKLAPHFALDPDQEPPTMVEWYGFQTRTIIDTVGEAAIGYTFASVPEAQPEEWHIQDGVDPDTGDPFARNWEQGHLGYGVFLTRQTNTMGDDDPGDLLPDQPGINYYMYATQVNLFQAASGDTNGDRLLTSEDIQNILGFGEYLTGEPATWPEGNFNGHQDPDDPDLSPLARASIPYCDSYDIQLILATNLWPPGDPAVPYAELPEGKPAGGEVELLVVPGEDGTFRLQIDTHGLPINSYAIYSADGALSGQQAANLGLFTQDDDFVIAGAGLSTLLDGVYDLGAVIGSGWDTSQDLVFTYTVEGVPGVYEGRLAVVPEPASVLILLAGALALLLWRRRRRTR